MSPPFFFCCILLSGLEEDPSLPIGSVDEDEDEDASSRIGVVVAVFNLVSVLFVLDGPDGTACAYTAIVE